ncbi:MAG: FAD-dependent oxidoreductase [Candidatus Heimdallarchaeaceae archaeon]
MNLKDQRRIVDHPILNEQEYKLVHFEFEGKRYQAKENEMLSSALIANGIQIFGFHAKDHAPQGIFCANGQCAQCTVLVNGVPVKSCMTPTKEGMVVEQVQGIPSLPEDDSEVHFGKIPVYETDVLIIGGGPAGLQAALTLAPNKVKIILIDDKDHLGGKLLLQTHKFFGSVEDSYEGTRGNDIAKKLEKDVEEHKNIDVWLSSPAIAVYNDKVVGVLRGDEYVLVKPRKLLIATGAREKMLSFPGNTLPGVYGAGAFQTLVNRDFVKSSEKIFLIGGGNVGLITGYHAIQAGIEVVGLVEALPKCGGYKVHEDKLRRLGVPIYTRHTILAAHGKDHVESITIAQIDENFKPIQDSERTFAVDTVLIAIGLDPVNEFYLKAQEFEMDVWAAGDALEIAEASSAMFNGKIAGMEIAIDLGLVEDEIPVEWREKSRILKSHPGPVVERDNQRQRIGVYPIIHCKQEIPCNPCSTVCSEGLINIKGGGLLGLPQYVGGKGLVTYSSDCIGCGRCVAICPGLAITLVDYRKSKDTPRVTLPAEVFNKKVEKGEKLTIVNEDGDELGDFKVYRSRILAQHPKTQLVTFELPAEIATKAMSFKVQKTMKKAIEYQYQEIIPDEAIICRCERVTAGEIRAYINKGIKDMNELKSVTKVGMGACGGKTCAKMIERLFREEGIPYEEVTTFVQRPLFVEVPLKHFLGSKEE